MTYFYNKISTRLDYLSWNNNNNNTCRELHSDATLERIWAEY